ncbi:hypothetical protein ABE453_14505 [Brevundimonas diminuta]|uniref:hypothetical protein n=1 Tax=Brevundimonas diminuta TaxID=293 RepID=UPI0032095557
MSQHNIIGSEAFTNRPYVLVRNVRPGGFRRRRSRSLIAYGVVAVLALSAGAAVAAFAMGPLLFDKTVEATAATSAPVEGGAAPLTAPTTP